MVERILKNTISDKLFKGKAIILLGARQTGKTTLLKSLFNNADDAILFNADDADVRSLFTNASSSRLKAVFGKKKIVIVDEAQRIANVGLSFKLITDQIPEIQLIATGSSSFELSNSVQEPLTGRKWEYKLFPLSFAEMVAHHGLLEEKRMLPQRLIYGCYPEIISNPGNERELLHQLTDSFLYKDLLMLDNIKKPEKIVQLLQALAFQIGNEVSYSELGRMIEMDKQTVEKYIVLLEKAFVIFRLGAFSRNLRKEIKHSRKIYFCDNGIRNALIAQFGQIELRSDIGALWENYLISERFKWISYSGIWSNQYFWRTFDNQEIDYIEESDGLISAFEFKWNSKAKAKSQKLFKEQYPNNSLKIINKDNFEEYLLHK